MWYIILENANFSPFFNLHSICAQFSSNSLTPMYGIGLSELFS